MVKYYHKSMRMISNLEEKILRDIQMGTIEILEASTYIRTYLVGNHLLQDQITKQIKLCDIVQSREAINNWFSLRCNLLCILLSTTICTLFVFDYHIHDPVILVVILLALTQIPHQMEVIYTIGDYVLTSLNSFKRIYSLNYIASDVKCDEDQELQEQCDVMPHGQINFLGVSIENFHQGSELT